jgi:hypothetical protein
MFLRNIGIYLQAHDVATQKTNINISTAVRNSNLIQLK